MSLTSSRKQMCPSAGRVTVRLLFSWLVAGTSLPSTIASWTGALSGKVNSLPLQDQPSISYGNVRLSKEDAAPEEHEFQLRHIFVHGLHDDPKRHVRRDVEPGSDVRIFGDDHQGEGHQNSFRMKSRKTIIQRLSDRSVTRMQSLYQEARYFGTSAQVDPSAWTMDEVLAPNVTDQETVVNLAKLSWCAYTEVPGTSDWPDIGGGRFNESQPFGWKGDNLRGHIFADKDNTTIVLSIKGTSPAFWDGAETTTNDKINDNIFFGCCCGEGGQFLWRHACSCKTTTYTCNQTCLVSALRQENRYYSASLELYGNVTEMYPNSNIWVVGHSLGGATSSLLGLTFGIPAVTFEAPGDALAAQRLGLPPPPGSVPGAPQTREYTGAVHFGHTADPIFMGTCNAATSACTLGGYAMQTQCHSGNVCRWDTVGDLGWRVGIGYHKIRVIIEDILTKYETPPECFPDDECVDCFNWKYFQSNGSTSTTSSSSSSSTTSLTRTTTCQTPGWWGCLDETTTSSSSTTSEGPYTSCVEYGWFGGCLESTTITPTHVSPILTATTVTATSCSKYGWFGGCLGNGTTTYTTTATVVEPPKMWTTSCVVYGWLWGCAETTTIPLLPTPSSGEALTTSCVEYGWWGLGPCAVSTKLYKPPSVAAIPIVPTITTTKPVGGSETTPTWTTMTATPNVPLELR